MNSDILMILSQLSFIFYFLFTKKCLSGALSVEPIEIILHVMFALHCGVNVLIYVIIALDRCKIRQIELLRLVIDDESV